MAPVEGLVMAESQSFPTEAASALAVSPAQRRDGLIFLSNMERGLHDLEARERQGIDPPRPEDNVRVGLLLPIALGMVGILVTHAIQGLATWELAMLFIFDVLFPLFSLPLGPRASQANLPFYLFLAAYMLLTDMVIPS